MDKLTVLWTSGDKELALKVVFRYIEDVLDKKAWENVRLIIWGPSVKLAGKDKAVRQHLTDLINKGVEIECCTICADEYDVTIPIEALGIKMGMVQVEITKIIQNQEPMLSL